jgi:GAF domain-containing protein
LTARTRVPGVGSSNAERIVGGLSVDDGLIEAIRAVEGESGASSVTLYLVEANGALSRRRLSSVTAPAPTWEEYDPRWVAPDGPIALVLRTSQPVIVANPDEKVEACGCVGDRARVAATVPTVDDDGVAGAIHVHWRYRRGDVTEDLRAIASVASLCAIAIRNSRLHAREVEAARLDGVRLAARTTVDDIGNDLASMRLLADMAYRQLNRGEAVDPDVLKTIVDGAASCLERMSRLVDVARVETSRSGTLPPVLNVGSDS